MENLERLLREHNFLEGLSPTQIQFIVGCARNERFPAGSYLLREGAVTDSFFLIRRGTVCLELHVSGRGVVVMETVGPGDIVGLSWVLAPHPAQLDSRAREDVVALVFDAGCLRKKMEEDHDLGYALTRRMLAKAYARLERTRMQRLDVYRSE